MMTAEMVPFLYLPDQLDFHMADAVVNNRGNRSNKTKLIRDYTVNTSLCMKNRWNSVVHVS